MCVILVPGIVLAIARCRACRTNRRRIVLRFGSCAGDPESINHFHGLTEITDQGAHIDPGCALQQASGASDRLHSTLLTRTSIGRRYL